LELYKKLTNRAFTLIEILVVIVLISAGILPIYSVLTRGQKQIIRSDTRSTGALYGASVIELSRTLGYDFMSRLSSLGSGIEEATTQSEEFAAIYAEAEENGYSISLSVQAQELFGGVQDVKRSLLLVTVTVEPKHRSVSLPIEPVELFTLISNPRASFY